MGTVYKIHPAIGVARVGNHPSAFFVGPEIPGAVGIEIDANGNESVLTHYKDHGRIKRQAARFRVFRFQQDPAGNLTLDGEVTANEAKIEWRVDLCNRKAALDHSPGPQHPAQPRNTGIADRASLIIRNPTPVSISGRNQPAKEFNGTFLGKPVYLGELRTDSAGRLLVLGGRGASESVPPHEPMRDFANNDRWHDDVADGPVTAVVTLPGQDPVTVHHPSWLTVAPPDFAPQIDAIVSLYDVAFQAAVDKGARRPDDVPSFRRHIKPHIERAANLRWVNSFDRWNDLAAPNWNALADKSAANAALRKSVADRIRNPGFVLFVLPDFLRTYLDNWEAGNFLSDLDDPDPEVPLPEQIDRAALDPCVGNNFYPGIEASINLRDKDIYARPFRLDHTNLGKVYPGCLTEIMAVPWQADFRDCDGGGWWPSQRPDIAMTRPADIPTSQAAWEAPIPEGDHQGMVDHVQQLGFIVPQQVNGRTVFVEQDRDPAFPREVLVAMAGGHAPRGRAKPKTKPKRDKNRA
jgi:L-Lysine epsilon oxidase N-terminal/L-lysine epsilon oxidase C-terminal domain